jgi:hypothetical protein
MSWRRSIRTLCSTTITHRPTKPSKGCSDWSNPQGVLDTRYLRRQREASKANATTLKSNFRHATFKDADNGQEGARVPDGLVSR